MNIYIRKIEENVEKNKSRGADQKQLPTLELVAIPEEQGADWIPLASLWRTKSGKGYSGKVKEYVSFGIDMDKYAEEIAKRKPKSDMKGVTDSVDYPENNLGEQKF